MTIKPKSYKEQETEKTRGRKRFLERLQEEKEAEKDIDNYKKEQEDDDKIQDHVR